MNGIEFLRKQIEREEARENEMYDRKISDPTWIEALKWDGETTQEYVARMEARRAYALKNVTVLVRTSELPDQPVARYCEDEIEGLKIWRRCADEIDNTYAQRAR